MDKLRKTLASHRGIILATALFFLLESIIVLFRYHAYYHTDTSYDQGIFNQVFWNGLQGRFFQSSLSGDLSVSVETPYVSYHRLGQHFTPSLLLWLPFYSILPKSATLLIINVILITVAGIILYFLAREKVNANLATWISTAYYCSGAVIGPTLGNFQDFSQIPLFGFSLFLALEKRSWIAFIIFSLLLLTVREDAGIMLFSVGLYLIFSKRYPLIGAVLCVVSFLYIVIITTLIMPIFSLDISHRFLLDEFGQYVDTEGGSSSLEVLWGIVSNPWRLLVELLTPFDKTLSFLVGLFIPLAFISWLSGATWLLIFCPLVVLLLREGSWALSLDIRYCLALIPGIFYGAILWWKQHPQVITLKFFRRFWITCLNLSIIVTILGNPNDALSFLIPYSYRPWLYFSPSQQLTHAQRINSLLAQIPRTASVSATSDIVPHLSSRREVLRFPNLELINDAQEKIWVEYALVDLWKNVQFREISQGDRRMFAKNRAQVEKILESNLYGLIDYQEGVLLLKRGSPSNAEALAAWEKEPLWDLMRQPSP
jgi:uncharacterized membrane protein